MVVSVVRLLGAQHCVEKSMTPANVMFLAAAGTGERRKSQSCEKLPYNRILLQTEESFCFFSRTLIAFGKKEVIWAIMKY